jgi:hypothetical protein
MAYLVARTMTPRVWAILQVFALSLLRDVMFAGSRSFVTMGASVYFLSDTAVWHFDANGHRRVSSSIHGSMADVAGLAR